MSWVKDQDFANAYKKRTVNTLLDKIINARDVYLGSVVKQVYEWDKSVSSLMRSLADNAAVSKKDIDILDLELAQESKHKINLS